MKRQIFGKILFFAVMLFCVVSSYAAEKDNDLLSACRNVCSRKNDNNPKLKKTEKIDACVKSCVKSYENLYYENLYINRKYNYEFDNNKKKKNIHANIGLGVATPLSWYAYTGEYDIGYGSLGGAISMSMEYQIENSFFGAEVFFAKLSEFNTYAYIHPLSISVRSYSFTSAFYLTYKMLETYSKYDMYVKLGLGYGKTTVHADFYAYSLYPSVSYRDSDNNTASGFSWYLAIGSNFSSNKNVGLEGRLSKHSYYDNATVETDFKTHDCVLYSAMFWFKFGKHS